jgi:hypothetical protein
MQCGHTANARDDIGRPVCVICVGINPGAVNISALRPDLTGRKARCSYYSYCGGEEDSTYNLAFFEYRGEGSFEAENRCKNCKFFHVAHTDTVRKSRNPSVCNNFEAIGSLEYDLYYDGCRGWD